MQNNLGSRALFQTFLMAAVRKRMSLSCDYETRIYLMDLINLIIGYDWIQQGKRKEK